MWSALQWILDLITNNSNVIAGVLAALLGWKTGLFTFVGKKAIAFLLKKAASEGSEFVQEQQDKQTIKEGDKLHEVPVTPEIDKERSENFKELVKGK